MEALKALEGYTDTKGLDREPPSVCISPLKILFAQAGSVTDLGFVSLARCFAFGRGRHAGGRRAAEVQ